MISADVVETMNRILPAPQNLIPVSFKKKLEYTGHYIQEYVDKKKLQIYFEWFKNTIISLKIIPLTNNE